MQNKKEERFIDKLKNAEPNSIISLSASDRARQWQADEDNINLKRKNHWNFNYLVIGLIFGVVGSYISTQIEYFFGDNLIFNLMMWSIFIICLTFFVLMIFKNKKEIRELKQLQEKWHKTKEIKIGTIMSPEYLEKFNEEINEQIKKEILEEIKDNKFRISTYCRKTNLPKSIVKRNLNDLTVEKRIGGKDE